MRSFYVINSGRFKRQDNTIVFIDYEEKKKTLPIEQINDIHIFAEVDFNSSFFNLMSQHDIFVHMYNYYGYYSGSYVPRNKQVSGYVDVQQAAHYLDDDKRIYLARRFIDGAVHHILRNLRRKKENTALAIQKILEEKRMLARVHQITELMGIEGRIRKIYYSAFNDLCKNPFFRFEKREKRPPTDPMNALISFGNGLLYTDVLRELYKTTINPTISFLHQPTRKRYSLCLDVAEIFKPLIIDQLIFYLINNRMLKDTHFDQVEGVCFLNEDGRKLFLSEYDKKMKTTVKHRKLNRNVSYKSFIRHEGYKLIKHFIGDEEYKPLKAWW
ncbi:subtype I-B CRISPR-associated endonuclease Cas1 [Laceyella sacchari]|nr:type I-B CRISPR-associated endonuclease Cas1b [Laceyella sediminis]AUS09239.1 subtype I-B CRISPR-associated endonuclease Cas1 [Laceyella sacchari]PRZ13590.1 CRISPR-associated protein Cas1 [Laceyella sediminis]